MPLTKNYSLKFSPPAPVIEINLSIPASGTVPAPIPYEAQIDSGADISATPEEAVTLLGLKQVDTLEAIDYHGVKRQESVYSVRVSVQNVSDHIVKVITTPEEYAVLGRDIINHWDLILDGKNGTLNIR